MRKTIILSVLAFLCLVAAHSPAQAQELKTIYYQGVLLDPAGATMPDGVYTITFAFYDAPADGKQLWMEKQKVYVTNGEFSVVLGADNPLNVSFKISRWLAVGVDGDETLADRTEFAIPTESFEAK